jgi:hypothetical protein
MCNATQINLKPVNRNIMSDRQQNVVKALVASGWFVACARLGNAIWIDGTRCDTVKGGTIYGIVGRTGRFEITVVQGEQSNIATTAQGLRTLVS